MNTRQGTGTGNLEINLNFEGGLEKLRDVSSVLSREKEVTSMYVSGEQVFHDLLLSSTGA